MNVTEGFRNTLSNISTKKCRRKGFKKSQFTDIVREIVNAQENLNIEKNIWTLLEFCNEFGSMIPVEILMMDQ